MHFVEQYLNKQHFFHAPHKWFWAVILSPLHAAEQHYQRRYHLTFAHAKKLFFFDMALLVSVFVLLGGTVIGFLYDPTVTDFVLLRMYATKDRIAAGEEAEYHIEYINESNTTLTGAVLALRLPNGFTIQSITPSNAYDTAARTVTIGTLHAGASGSVQVRGWFYGTPEQDDHISATISYHQNGKTLREQKIAKIITTLRGSTLHATLDIADTILGNGTVPFVLTLANSGTTPIRDIVVPLSFEKYFSLHDITTSSIGTVEKQHWVIHRESAEPFTSAVLHGTIAANIAEEITSTDIVFSPTLVVAGETFTQTSVKKTLRVVHPRVHATAAWKHESTAVQPGEQRTATLTIANTGNTPISDIEIRIPLSATINSETAKKENGGRLEKDALVISSARHANLTALGAQSETTIDLIIPVAQTIASGENVLLDIKPVISASIPTVQSTRYKSTVSVPALSIGSSLKINAALRYFTEEGDQIGRGPLPPRVGSETKYWAFVRVLNTTNEVNNIIVTAALPPAVTWTGKSSISHGKQPTQQNRTISWTIPSLLPHSQAGMYLELAFTPDSSHIGQAPTVLSNLTARGEDIFIEQSVSASHPNLDITLPTDATARAEGVKVQP